MDLSPSAERQLGVQTFNETLREYKSLILPPSHPTSKYVERVAKRIVEGGGLGKLKGSTASPMSGWGGGLFGDTGLGGGDEWERSAAAGTKKDGGEQIEWEVFVINDLKTKNAFVLPGGKIFVFTGILPVCANEDGLASVLGHEVAHQVARHSAERMSSLKVLSLLGFVLEAVGLDVGLSRLLLTFLLSLPNSRKAESEADFIGLRLMSKACFDPRESPKMWTRMSASETSNTSSWSGVANLDFMSTHPANGKRIKAIESWLPEALNVRAASPTCGDMVGAYEAFREETHLPRRAAPQQVLLGGERMGRW
ncbi:peptidase family M48-domain-containing protein [Mrakia frigida]|uniref:M48 family metallopeptidase n=1 Tax=Mrakia frigida TaxID=29902 RepID=UPI003FCBF4CF